MKLQFGSIRKTLLWTASVLAAAGFWGIDTVRGEQFDGSAVARYLNPGVQLPDPKSKELQHARADQWRLVGKTVFVKGNVYIPYGNVIIRADEAMVDTESKDVEAKGNITMSTIVREPLTVNMDEFNRLLDIPDVTVEVGNVVIDPLGNKRINVTVVRVASSVQAERLSGNLASGLINFKDLTLRVNNFICKAKRGLRQPGGEIRLEDLRLSSCEYMQTDQSHYSIGLSTADIYPHETEGFGFSNTEKNYSEYSLWGYNGTIRIYDIPIFWLPVVYKPKDESLGLFHFQAGKNSDWGYYVLLSKNFQFMDYPAVSTTLNLDWYSMRGFGYGERTSIVTENSRTELNAYAIYDTHPYESSSEQPWHDYYDSRLDIPHYRFELQMTHMTHITPRLDIRAQVDWMSDAYMLDDYFSNRGRSLTEPASYAALEYQGDRFSASLYTRFQVNDFYTTVQRLPELRLDIPRQEIIPGWNLYYQGSHTAEYLRMSWADFDRKLINPDGELRDYDTGRFDSVNFLYFPLRTRYLNIVPRAGLRLTGYTDTSRTKLREEDIFRMQLAADPEEDFGVAVRNYDSRGGAKLRVAAEFGVEANTKIYRSWNDLRCAFLELDGLRHVCEPYINYTFITDPTVSRDRLYFFDDVDRIRKQNFIRFGLRNRLQTRAGTFGNASVREWFSMENYWDIFFTDDDKFNSLGDICTKISFTPVKELSFTGFMSIDAGQNQDHDIEAIRGSRRAGRPGIDGTFFNRLYLQVKYNPIEDITLSFAYDYKDGYIGRSAYSMGSTLTEFDSGSAFDQYYITERTQTLNFGVSMPLTPDRRTFGSYSLAYDIEEGAFTRHVFGLSRTFHCVRVTGLVEIERDRDDDDEIDYDVSFAIYATLVGLEGPVDTIRRSAVSRFSGNY